MQSNKTFKLFIRFFYLYCGTFLSFQSSSFYSAIFRIQTNVHVYMTVTKNLASNHRFYPFFGLC